MLTWRNRGLITILADFWFFQLPLIRYFRYNSFLKLVKYSLGLDCWDANGPIYSTESDGVNRFCVRVQSNLIFSENPTAWNWELCRLVYTYSTECLLVSHTVPLTSIPLNQGNPVSFRHFYPIKLQNLKEKTRSKLASNARVEPLVSRDHKLFALWLQMVGFLHVLYSV